MTHFQLLTFIPLWVVMLIFVGLMLISMVIGNWLRRFVGIDPATVGSGQLLVGTLSIMTLLIGFTFSLALNRHDKRQDLLLEESNAIRALHRTLEHVEHPDKSNIGIVLETYAIGRLQFVESDLFSQQDQQSVRMAEREQLNLAMSEIVPTVASRVGPVQLIAAATRTLDAGTHLEQAMMAHVPTRVVLVLYLLSTGAALLIGVSLGANLHKLWLPAVIWSFLLSAAIFTVVDLDAPQWGSIRLDSTPLKTAIKAVSNY
jgi:hypothetical protein